MNKNTPPLRVAIENQRAESAIELCLGAATLVQAAVNSVEGGEYVNGWGTFGMIVFGGGACIRAVYLSVVADRWQTLQASIDRVALDSINRADEL